MPSVTNAKMKQTLLARIKSKDSHLTRLLTSVADMLPAGPLSNSVRSKAKRWRQIEPYNAHKDFAVTFWVENCIDGVIVEDDLLVVFHLYKQQHGEPPEWELSDRT